MSDDDTHPWVEAIENVEEDPSTYADVEEWGLGTSSEDDATDESDASGLLFVCQVCEYRTDIETPQRRTEHWCRGRCDGFQTFVREDAIED